MTHFEEKLKDLTITGTSPDKTVTMTFSRPYELGLEFQRGALGGHSADSLGRQVSAVARGLLAAYRQQTKRAIDEALGDETFDDDAPLPPKMRRFRERQADITAYGKSGRGYVLAKRHAQHGIAVQIQPDALSRLSEPELAVEITSALTAALRDHREKATALRREIFV